MAALEIFDRVKATDAGWDTDITETCAGSANVVMLVGPHGRDHNPKQPAMKKVYTNLPAHNQVRITGTGHFVDDWQGEAAYIQVQGHFVWTDSHDQRNQVSNFNVCGDAMYPESKFTVSFDITVPHEDSSVRAACCFALAM